MKKLIYLFILIPGFMFTSCDPKPTHFYPLSYLPAYPGSYWKYADNNGDTVISTTSPDYVLDSKDDGTSYYVPIFTPPKWSAEALWGYDFHVNFSAATGLIEFYKLVDEVPVGTEWTTIYSQYFSGSRKIIATDTNITVGITSYYPTIVVEMGQIVYSQGLIYHPLNRYYFTRDIGLVMWEEMEADSVENTYYICDHHIHHP